MSGTGNWEEHYTNIVKAREANFDVVFGDDKTLLLDIDTNEQLKQYESLKQWFLKRFGVERERWKSKSDGTHIVLTLNEPMSLELRIALQVIMGSDPRRGMCELIQVVDRANPIALFKPTERMKKEIS